MEPNEAMRLRSGTSKTKTTALKKLVAEVRLDREMPKALLRKNGLNP